MQCCSFNCSCCFLSFIQFPYWRAPGNNFGVRNSFCVKNLRLPAAVGYEPADGRFGLACQLLAQYMAEERSAISSKFAAEVFHLRNEATMGDKH